MWFCVGAIVSVLPTLAFNWWIYGSPLLNGYTKFDEFIEATNPRSESRLFTVDVGALWRNVRLYWLRPEVALLLAAALLGVIVLARRRIHPIALAIAVLALTAHLVLTGGRVLNGTEEFRGSSSFSRYSAPVLSVACALSAVGVAWLFERSSRIGRRMGVIVVVACVVGSGWMLVRMPQGVLDAASYTHRQQVARDAVLRAVPSDAVVITRRWDKYLWPDRTTLVMAYLVSDPSEAQDPDEPFLIDQMPTPQRLAEVVSEVSRREIPVFLLLDSYPRSESWAEWIDWHLFFEHDGLCWRATDVDMLWEVAPHCTRPLSAPGTPAVQDSSEESYARTDSTRCTLRPCPDRY
jgi:hypothetical protein